MVLTEEAKILKESQVIKDTLLSYESRCSLLTDRNIWLEQQKLQQLNRRLLVMDLNFALEKNVEKDLWVLGFKQQIESLQLFLKDKKNPQRAEAQSMLSLVLQTAAGFYLSLLQEISCFYKLDLPFRRRSALLGAIEDWSPESSSQTTPAAVRYISQHCLVHLGDLARYRQEMNEAYTFYKHAVLVCPTSGQPYNQLALIAWRRERRLDALYWHVRSLLVVSPFPPASVNLARTLASAANSPQSHDNSYIKGIQLTSITYLNDLFRFYHSLVTLDDLDETRILFDKLSTSVESFLKEEKVDGTIFVKIACISLWSIHHTNQLLLDESKTEDVEVIKRAARLATQAFVMHIQALFHQNIPSKLYPAIKIYLEYLKSNPEILNNSAFTHATALWAGLCREMNKCVKETDGFSSEQYNSLPLPEDEEVNGFLPFENAMKLLHFESIGIEKNNSVTTDIIHLLRCERMVRLAEWLADYLCDHQLDVFSVIKNDGKLIFKCKDQDLNGDIPESNKSDISFENTDPKIDNNVVLTPNIISMADFKQKVRIKPVGILKPQGSLERSREERTSIDSTQEELQEKQEVENSKISMENRRKMRMNVAMAAILRKQDDCNKQVKFAASPSPDNLESSEPSKEIEGNKVVESILLKTEGERKTGGILSLKDKSAGYPHLVKTDNEEKEQERKKIQMTKNHSGQQMHNKYSQNNHKHFNELIKYNNASEGKMNMSANNLAQGPIFNARGGYIRLPVVNPKEIDVRTSAMREPPQSDYNIPNTMMPNCQMPYEKKSFMADLPPRFVNQFNRGHPDNIQSKPFNQNQYGSVSAGNDWRCQQQNIFGWWDCPPTCNPPPLPQSVIYNCPPQPNNSMPNNVQFNHQYQQRNNSFYHPDAQIHSPRPLESVNPLMGSTFNNNPSNGTSNVAFSNNPMANSMQCVNDMNDNSGIVFNQHQNRPSEMMLGIENDFTNDQGHRRTSDLMLGVLANNNMNMMQKLDLPEGRSYSLFSSGRDNATLFHPSPNSLWIGPGPSPLERLLEQQKQMKQEPH